jgi:hypothetical protein
LDLSVSEPNCIESRVAELADCESANAMLAFIAKGKNHG